METLVITLEESYCFPPLPRLTDCIPILCLPLTFFPLSELLTAGVLLAVLMIVTIAVVAGYFFSSLSR